MYAIAATSIETGQRKYWADGFPVWWVANDFEAYKFETVREASAHLNHKLSGMFDRFCIDIVPA